MRPRFVGHVGLADAITVANGMLGFVAVVFAPVDPQLAARLILLAAVGDGLDGVVARRTGGTAVGKYLDSLADVAAFGAAPAMLVTAVAVDGWGLSLRAVSPRLLVAIVIPALFLGMVIVRLGLYTAYDAGNHHTEGVPGTLAATIIAAGVLAEVTAAGPLVISTAALTYLMVSRVQYPDLLARDATIMGIVQTLAILVPDFLGRTFPYALLILALSYLLLGPRFYWRNEGDNFASDDESTPSDGPRQKV